MTTKFIHLRVHSDYSLGEGAIKIKDLVSHAQGVGFPALALTDKNNLFASLEFSLEASKSGVQPIIGAVLTVNYESAQNYGSVLAIAKNEDGYQNLLKLVSKAHLDIEPQEQSHISLESLKDHSEGLILLCGGLDGIVNSLFKDNRLDEAKSLLADLSECFKGNFYIELQRHGEEGEAELEKFLLDYAYENNVPIVATNKVCFLKPSMQEAQDAMMCISAGRYLLEDDRARASKEHYFKSEAQMKELFADLPEAIANTEMIAKRCSVMSEARDPLLPGFESGDGKSEDEQLAGQSKEGLEKRIAHIKDEGSRKKYFDRLEYELGVISKMKYPGYFLIVSDFIKWSKSQDIPVGPGRGSGAGSVVAWALEITDLDPLEFGLLFERFLNPERVSMPDFDIDFCQDRREEVIEYVKNKYGSDRVAQIITFGKLQARAVLRDVGRVLHMPYMAIDRICKMVPNNPANPVTLGQAIDLDRELRKSREGDPEIDKLLSISLQLEGMNRHVSTHAAGVVIADRPIVELVPLYKDQNSDMPAVQYSMKYAESAGLVKFDFLGLKTLTVISWACKLINRNEQKVDINNIPLTDEKTYEMLSSGATTGVFQFESSGMREAIKKLKPDNLGDLIALGSLYRPGPMDNIPTYINRKHGREQPTYIHPKLESVLEETFGIIVYQEQVIELAQVLAGYTLGGADLLRRAMGKKIKAEMEAQRATFVNGCVDNGIDKGQAEDIFALVEKFASYGFNKSHAAAYALISYQTAYLKANYPLEFLVASMNLEIDDTDKINIFKQEADRMAIEVLPPDVNKSFDKFAIEGAAIRYGLGALKNVGMKAVEEVVKEREECGDFKSAYDFVERCGNGTINKRMLENMAKAGAFDALGEDRRKIFDNAETLVRYGGVAYAEKNNKQVGLFGALDEEAHAIRPKLIESESWDSKKLLEAEFESIGFYLSSHPLKDYELKLQKSRVTQSLNVEHKATEKGTKLTVAGVITSRKIRSSQRGKYAFIQLSDMSGLLEVSVFNEEMLYQNEELLNPGQVVYMRIDARKDDTGLRAIVESVIPIDDALDHVRTSLKACIKDPKVIPLLKSKLGDQGKPVRIEVQLPDGAYVKFASKGNMFLNFDAEQELRKVSGLEIVEE